MGAADGYAQVLEEGVNGDLSEKQLESVGRIRRSIGTSLRLIQDLLDLARAEAGQLELERTRTDIAHAAHEVVEDFRAQAAEAGLALEVRAPDPLIVDTDPTRVRQILANLLSNAVKYTAKGRVTITVEVRPDGTAFRPGDWLAASVMDTGPGIPENRLQQVFQEFSRLGPEDRRGTGVGIAISRHLARLLGGDITVQSEIGRGSTFTLWLPVLPSV